jgi:hypothetical protein
VGKSGFEMANKGKEFEVEFRYFSFVFVVLATILAFIRPVTIGI